MSHEVETVAFAAVNGIRKPWWYQTDDQGAAVGVPVPGFMDVETALEKARAGFSVLKTPIYAKGRIIDAEPEIEIGGFRALTRSDTGAVLSVVSDRYQPIQNRATFERFKKLFGEQAVLETAGVLRGGRCVFGLARLTRCGGAPRIIAGDQHQEYLYLSAWHDGVHRNHADITLVRVECMNTLGAAEGRSEASGNTGILHVGDTDTAMAIEDEGLKAKLAGLDYLADSLESMSAKRIEPAARKDLVREIFYPATVRKLADTDKLLAESEESRAIVSAMLAESEAKRREVESREVLADLLTERQAETIEEVITVSEGADLQRHKGTAYALLQGVTGYVDHSKLSGASADRRASYIAHGAGRDIKRRALRVLSR